VTAGEALQAQPASFEMQHDAMTTNAADRLVDPSQGVSPPQALEGVQGCPVHMRVRAYGCQHSNLSCRSRRKGGSSRGGSHDARMLRAPALPRNSSTPPVFFAPGKRPCTHNQYSLHTCRDLHREPWLAHWRGLAVGFGVGWLARRAA
jgi:hypothetical protein